MQADIHACMHGYIHGYRRTHTHAYKHTYIHTYIQTYRQTDRQTDRQTYRQTDINAYKQTCHINQANINVTIFGVVLIRKETIRLNFHVSISKIWKLTEW